MEKQERVLVIGGAVAIGALLLFSAARRARAQQIAALNQPGLTYSSQTAYASDSGLAQIIGATANGLSQWIGGQFANGGSSNDPGLEGSTNGDYIAGDEYSSENADPYSDSYNTLSAVSDDSSAFDSYDE